MDAQTSYALVDFPNHSNVGDSAIWLGEIALLTKITGRDPSYVSTKDGFKADDLERVCPEGPIFIHGGGNFGDIWRKHQDFREYLLDTFADRQIIQLPQSIQFKDKSSASACAKLISKHRRYTLLVRDRQSESFATQHLGCNALLTPDAAFGLGAIRRPCEAQHRVVLLLRTDVEQQANDFSAFQELKNAYILDWLYEPKGTALQIAVGAKIKAAFALRDSHRAAVMRFNDLASHRVRRGLNILASGEIVVTDRLHAHILCFLLNVRHVALDNNYGKVFGYIDAWDHASSLVQKATSARDAMDKLRGMPSLSNGIEY